MEKYWIIVDGKPQGPFTPEQLKLRRDFTADLPVWASGMTDWTTAGQVPSLAKELAEISEAEETIEQPQEVHEEAQQGVYVNTSSNSMYAQFTPAGKSQLPTEPMPKSYLGWNIAMTLCCCLPVGIAGIFFSSMVAQKWQRGDIEGARKASDRAAWCLILSFVLGLVCMPFQMLYQMASL